MFPLFHRQPGLDQAAKVALVVIGSLVSLLILAQSILLCFTCNISVNLPERNMLATRFTKTASILAVGKVLSVVLALFQLAESEDSAIKKTVQHAQFILVLVLLLTQMVNTMRKLPITNLVVANCKLAALACCTVSVLCKYLFVQFEFNAPESIMLLILVITPLWSRVLICQYRSQAEAILTTARKQPRDEAARESMLLTHRFRLSYFLLFLQ